MGEVHEISMRERIRLNLVSAMDQANISQVQLAEKLGISKGTVNNWARGNNSPDVEMVPKICKVLGISISDLYSLAKSDCKENDKTREFRDPEISLSVDERQLVEDYRTLNDQGQELIRQQMELAVESPRYKKYDDLSNVEKQA